MDELIKVEGAVYTGGHIRTRSYDAQYRRAVDLFMDARRDVCRVGMLVSVVDTRCPEHWLWERDVTWTD